jgi:hypothetical protein
MIRRESEGGRGFARRAGLTIENCLESTANFKLEMLMAGIGLAAVSSREVLRPFASAGAMAGYAGAVCWAAMGVDSVLRPWQDNRRDTFWMLPFVLTMIAFYFVHRVQQGRSKWEAPAFWTVILASALTFLGSVGLQLNIAWLKGLGFPGGAILWMIGLIAFWRWHLEGRCTASLCSVGIDSAGAWIDLVRSGALADCSAAR